jgi:hypothetical protein
MANASTASLATSLFSRYIIKVDYDSSKIEFWTNGSMKNPGGGHTLKTCYHQPARANFQGKR